MTEPTPDYRRLGELSDEFTALWERLQAFYLDFVAGFHFLIVHLRDEQARDRSLVQGSVRDLEGIPRYTNVRLRRDFFGKNFVPLAYTVRRRAQLRRVMPRMERISKRSDNCAWFHFMISGTITYVPNTSRQKDYTILKTTTNAFANTLVAIFRATFTACAPPIVHHRGIATDVVIRRKVIKWFKPGDEIAISPEGYAIHFPCVANDF